FARGDQMKNIEGYSGAGSWKGPTVLTRTILALLIGTVGVGCTTSPSAVKTFDRSVGAGVPLPNDWEVRPPDPSVPEQSGALSGVWFGTWDNMRACILIVESVTPPSASIVYAWGPRWGSN